MRMFQINTNPIPLLSESSCQFMQISSALAVIAPEHVGQC